MIEKKLKILGKKCFVKGKDEEKKIVQSMGTEVSAGQQDLLTDVR